MWNTSSPQFQNHEQSSILHLDAPLRCDPGASATAAIAKLLLGSPTSKKKRGEREEEEKHREEIVSVARK